MDKILTKFIFVSLDLLTARNILIVIFEQNMVDRDALVQNQT